jgi:hypothetical protein
VESGWIRDKWLLKKKRRGFIKMHVVAVDTTKTKKILAMRVAKENECF